MAMIGQATVAVGDWLRRTSDDWEGSVTAVNDDAGTVTLRMNNGVIDTLPVADCYYNGWDAKYAASKQAP